MRITILQQKFIALYGVRQQEPGVRYDNGIVVRIFINKQLISQVSVTASGSIVYFSGKYSVF